MSKLQTPGPKLKSNDGRSTVNTTPKTAARSRKKADVKDKGEAQTDAEKLAKAKTPAEAAKIGGPGPNDATPEAARTGRKGESMVPPSVIYPIRDDLPPVRDPSANSTQSGVGKSIWDEEMGNGWKDYAEGKDRTDEYRARGDTMRKEAYMKGRQHAEQFAKLPKYGEGGDLSEDDIVTAPATKIEDREAA